MLGGAYVAMTMLTVVCIGVFLSTLTDSTAALRGRHGGLGGHLERVGCPPGLTSVKPFLPTRYWDEWHNCMPRPAAGHVEGAGVDVDLVDVDHARGAVALSTKGHPVVARVACGVCGTDAELSASKWRCACGGPFSFTSVHVDPPAALARVTMGEGDTPLERLSIGGRPVAAKIEFESPTGSFKDRGAAM